MGFCTGDCPCGRACQRSDDFCQHHNCKRDECPVHGKKAKQTPPPKTLDEAIAALGVMLCQEDRQLLMTGPSRRRSGLHHSLGRHLRNEWGLWHDSPLAQHLKAVHDVEHPDDMTHFLIVAFCKKSIRTAWQRIAADE